MNFVDLNTEYERWLKNSLPFEASDFTLKHQRMDENLFAFFRATFFRWAERVPDYKGCKVLGVADLHIENFGTWRDLEGRLCWGVNDFDEASYISFLYDLVRLTVSIALAREGGAIAVKINSAVEALLAGYEHGLKSNGKPFILEEGHSWLTEVATARLKNGSAFWNKLKNGLKDKVVIPPEAKTNLIKNLPNGASEIQYGHRIAGLGSLGRKRIVALAKMGGSAIARETKPLAPSAITFVRGEKSSEIHYQTIVQRSIRMHDPFLKIENNWVVRRLSPQCSRIELHSLPHKDEELHLIGAMGFETANVHLGSQKPKILLADFAKLKTKEVVGFVDEMTEAVIKDWKKWKNR